MNELDDDHYKNVWLTFVIFGIFIVGSFLCSFILTIQTDILHQRLSVIEKQIEDINK